MGQTGEIHEPMLHDPARNDVLELVDEEGCTMGSATKQDAHEQGLLHRAFSIVVTRTDEDGLPEILVTQRAYGKYHSGGLWTNACCSHPRYGEEIQQAVQRRAKEELGVTLHAIKEVGAFTYRAAFNNGLVEHEYDHVFLAQCADDPIPHPDEVESWRWVAPGDLEEEIAQHTERFTAWAPQVFSLALIHVQEGET